MEAEEWDLITDNSRARESERSEVLAVKRLQYAGVPETSSTGKLLLEMHVHNSMGVSLSKPQGAPLRLGHTRATAVAPARNDPPLAVEDYDD